MTAFANWMISRHDIDDTILMELFSQAEVMAYEPENGHWEPPLEQNTSYHRFYFSIPSEELKFCSGDSQVGYRRLPCYSLNISNSGGDISISFKHEYTGYTDRFGEGGKGREVMNSVLHGLSQYLERHKPKTMSWSAVSKSRAGAVNPQARGKVYAMWATKNLYPDQYVPIRNDYWVRRDVYDREYVPRGYPSPNEFPGSPLKSAREFMDAYEKAQRDIYRREEEERERNYERQQRLDRRNARQREREELERLIASPASNPQQLQVGDEVIDKTTGEIYVIVKFRRRPYDSTLLLRLRRPEASRATMEKEASEVAKATGENRIRRQTQMGDIIRQNNPLGLQVGDEVIYGRNRDVIYRIISFDVSRQQAPGFNQYRNTVSALIQPLQQNGPSRKVPLAHLRPKPEFRQGRLF